MYFYQELPLQIHPHLANECILSKGMMNCHQGYILSGLGYVLKFPRFKSFDSIHTMTSSQCCKRIMKLYPQWLTANDMLMTRLPQERCVRCSWTACNPLFSKVPAWITSAASCSLNGYVRTRVCHQWSFINVFVVGQRIPSDHWNVCKKGRICVCLFREQRFGVKWLTPTGACLY